MGYLWKHLFFIKQRDSQDILQGYDLNSYKLLEIIYDEFTYLRYFSYSICIITDGLTNFNIIWIKLLIGRNFWT